MYVQWRIRKDDGNLWSIEFICPSNPILDEIGRKIFTKPYMLGPFAAARHQAPPDSRIVRKAWMCSDCTGEALREIIMARENVDPHDQIRADIAERIRLSIDNLLRFQSPSGGYTAFEPIGAGECLEPLNITEIFGKCIVEYEYIECTGSVVTALFEFRLSRNWEYRADEVRCAIHSGIRYIHTRQGGNGGWLAIVGCRLCIWSFLCH